MQTLNSRGVNCGFYHLGSPFPHVVIDGLVLPEAIEQDLENVARDVCSEGFLYLLSQITDKQLQLGSDEFKVSRRGATRLPSQADPAEVLAILFLNDCPSDWDASLELFTAKPHRSEKTIEPKCGRLVLLDPLGFHGFPHRLNCPRSESRRTLEVHYW